MSPSRPRTRTSAGGDDELHRLARAASTGRLTFGLAVAPLGGRFQRVAAIHVHADARRALHA